MSLSVDKFQNTDKKIDLGHSVVYLRDDGIIQVNFGALTELDVKEAKQIVAATGKLTKGKKALILNVAGKLTTATKDARDYAATEEGSIYTIADAYVIRSLAQKLIANFYINFHKPLVPTRVFTTESEAVDWLNTFKD